METNTEKNRKEKNQTATNITELKEKEYQEELTKLWNILIALPKEKQEELVKTIPPNILQILRTRKNPFKKSVMQTNERILAFNLVNLREKYLRRFAMTSMIAFLFRMSDEWEPELEESPKPGVVIRKKYISENDKEFADIYNELLKKLKYNRPPEMCDSIISKYQKVIDQILVLVEKYIDTNQEKLAKSDSKKRITNDEKIKIDEIIKTNTASGGKIENYFICTDKKCKHFLDYLNKDRDALNSEVSRIQGEISRQDFYLEQARRKVDFTTKKLELLKKYMNDKKDHPENYKEEVPKLSETVHTPEDRQKSEDPYANMPKNLNLVVLTSKDKQYTVEEYQNIVDLRQKEVEIIEKAIGELETKRKMFDDELKNKFADIEKYQQISRKNRKICKLIISQTIKKLDNIKYEEYEPTEEEYESINSDVKKQLNIKKTKEEYNDKQRDIVSAFLLKYLHYNPDNHVKCAYKPNFQDEFRTPIVNFYQARLQGEISEDYYRQKIAEVKEKLKKYREAKEREYEISVIPPDDTFARLDRYIENHYEELRQATDDIYNEKSELEFMLVPLEIFEGQDAEAKADEWQRKYAEEFEADVYRAKFNQWSFVGSWEQNREKRNFYTKNSEIIKRIIEQSESDQKIGRDLMSQRTRDKKKENAKQFGSDSPALPSYKTANPTEVEKYGAKPIEKIPKSQTPASKDEKEVAWYHFKPNRKKGSRGFRTNATTGSFNIPAEDKPVKGYMMNPGESHKIIQEAEMRQAISVKTD